MLVLTKTLLVNLPTANKPAAARGWGGGAHTRNLQAEPCQPLSSQAGASLTPFCSEQKFSQKRCEEHM